MSVPRLSGGAGLDQEDGASMACGWLRCVFLGDLQRPFLVCCCRVDGVRWSASPQHSFIKLAIGLASPQHSDARHYTVFGPTAHLNFCALAARPQDCDWGSDTKSKQMLGPRLLALLGVASAEPKEQWNGPAGAPKCIDKWQKCTDGLAAGERAITMFSQSYVCDGNDCDVVGAYSPKYSFACATKGPCLLYTSPSPRDKRQSRMPSSA